MLSMSTAPWQIVNAGLVGAEEQNIKAAASSTSSDRSNGGGSNGEKSGKNDGSRSGERAKGERAQIAVKNGGLYIKNGKIERITQLESEVAKLLSIDLHGLLLFPGLINGHDSLLASYQAFQGLNYPYSNWLAWDNELKASSLFRQRMMLSPADLYQLGAYRNTICAATTVVDHIPHHVRRPYQGHLLPRLLPDFGIAHSACSYSLDWGKGISQEYEYAAQNDLPFILHIAEGFDEESRYSLKRLDELGALGKETVLVHGLSLNENDLDLIAKRGAHLVWCPESNMSIYGLTAPIEKMLERGINICLGSDSAMTGSSNLFSTIQAARSCYLQRNEEELSPQQIWAMLTSNAALAFRIADRGRLAEGAKADFFVLRGKMPQDPLLSLCEADIEQLVLVVCEGIPLYAEESLEKIFTNLKIAYDRVKIKGAVKFFRQHASEIGEGICKLMKRAGNSGSLHFLPVAAE